MKPEAWHAIIGVGLVCVGLAVIGGVAYMLYTPNLSFSFLTNHSASQTGTQTYTCSDGATAKVVFKENTASVTFNGRTEEVAFTPVPEGIEVPPDAWDRFVSVNGEFVLWKRGNAVLLQESGVVIHGECTVGSE